MLRDEIYKDMTEAMKAQDKLKLEALRYLWSLIHNEEIEVKRGLEDSEVIKVIGGEVKKRKEALEQIKESGREDVIEAEQEKLKVLEEFLPEQMGEEEVGNLVSKVIEELGTKDFGAIMKEVMKRVAGRAEGKIVAEVVRSKLGQ